MLGCIRRRYCKSVAYAIRRSYTWYFIMPAVPTGLLALQGNDEQGHFIRADLKKMGVTTQFIKGIEVNQIYNSNWLFHYPPWFFLQWMTTSQQHKWEVWMQCSTLLVYSVSLLYSAMYSSRRMVRGVYSWHQQLVHLLTRKLLGNILVWQECMWIRKC